MDSDIYEVIYCPEDDEYRVYCEICDKNHLKSQTHFNKIFVSNKLI